MHRCSLEDRCIPKAACDRNSSVLGSRVCVSRHHSHLLRLPWAKTLWNSCCPRVFSLSLSLSLSLSPFSRSNDLAFYSPAGHRAAFALPPVALRELAKPRPSLSDTSADLESMMAYGEESTEHKIDGRWEPDVSAGELFVGERTSRSAYLGTMK